ncbi:translation initiation factor IF-2-like isoform X2 [Coturnix japonica]|uniref:translation initiation factor IF-2-like isoform X2 n=1 Tax=Coturnix japonica TaxID=93934 RepID=UPI0013A5EBD4|nr:translation initiation factor IF-2-like isoform X2 [Coturnix japonica]
MRPAAIRSGPWLKRTRPGRCAPTSTVRPSARTTQVLALKAGKGPEEETQPAASAQEGTEDADRISTSCSLAAEQAAEQEAEQEAEQAAEQAAEQEAEQASEQAADDGAKGAGTSQAMLDAKSSKERARSTRKGGSFLPCCLSSSTSSAVLTDQQEEKKDIAERDTVAVAGKEPVSTSLPGAESLPPASPVPGNLQRKVRRHRWWAAGVKWTAWRSGTQSATAASQGRGESLCQLVEHPWMSLHTFSSLHMPHTSTTT